MTSTFRRVSHPRRPGRSARPASPARAGNRRPPSHSSHSGHTFGNTQRMGGVAAGHRPRIARMTSMSRPLILGRDLAVDLGTANTLVYVRGRGVVLDEPSVVAVETGTNRARGGRESRAKEMVGRTPGVACRAVRPLRDGVISDADLTERMLRWFVDQVRPSPAGPPADGRLRAERGHRRRAARPRGRRHPVRRAPASTSSRSRWPPRSAPACRSTTPRRRWSSTSAAAPPTSAVISLGGIVSSPVDAGRRATRSTTPSIAHVKTEYSLLLGERSAEDIKTSAGSAFPLGRGALHAGARPRPRDRPAQDGVHLVARGAPRDRDAGRSRSSSWSAPPSTSARRSWPATSSTAASP